MTRLFTVAFAALAIASIGSVAQAGPEDFRQGPVITGFGGVAEVEAAPQFAEGTVLKVAFDVAAVAADGGVNRSLDSAARFINMHVAAGLSLEQVKVAIVVHGPAASDILVREGNASAPLVAALIEAGASISLCGQTAADRDIGVEDLLPGVGLSLSAMTSHALLQQDGYTLNPF